MQILFTRWTSMLLVAFLFCLTGVSFSQVRVVPIASGDGVIEDMLTSDAANRAVNPNTVYELERNGYYTIKTPISNTGYHLWIRAAAGAGKRPIVRPFAGTTRSFAPTGDITLEGLYINGVDAGGTLKQNSLRTGTASIRITIKECQFDRDLQSVLRVESANTKWFVFRSVISNLGLMADNNGRAWDDRGQNVDTLVMEDNVFYNITGRMTRDGGGITKFWKFNHNTCVNVFDQPLALGEVVEAYVTNNLFVNTDYSGSDSLGSYQVSVLKLRADTVGGTPQIVRIHHNNFYATPGLVAGYPVGPRGQIKTTEIYDTLATSFMKRNGDTSYAWTLPVAFLDGPRDEVGPMQDFWDNAVPVGSKRNMFAGPDSGRGTWDSTQVPWDFRYATSNPLYALGSDGKPIGAGYVFGVTVGVQDAQDVPTAFGLAQNYPNPFNPSTTITFQLAHSGSVTIKVHDLLGREVATLLSEERSAGTHAVTFDGSQLPSGIYFYSLSSGAQIASRRMVLVK